MTRATAFAAALVAALVAVVVLGLLLPGPSDTQTAAELAAASSKTHTPAAPSRNGGPGAGPSANRPGGTASAPSNDTPDGHTEPSATARRHAERGIDPTRPGAGVPGGMPPRDGIDGEPSSTSDVPDGFRDQASVQRADWLEGRMRDFLGAVEPDLKDAGLSRTCSSSGRTCTFEGPMTDDFVRQWFDALAYGEMSNDEVLQGAVFSELAFTEGDDGKHFTITAKHPTSK